MCRPIGGGVGVLNSRAHPRRPTVTDTDGKTRPYSAGASVAPVAPSDKDVYGHSSTGSRNNNHNNNFNNNKTSLTSSSRPARASCCLLWRGLLMPRTLLMWPVSLQVLLVTLCCCKHASSDGKLNLIHARLLNMLKTKQSLFYRRQLRSGLDLREHRLFHSDPKLDCCPTLTELDPRRTGINPSGMVLELFTNPNFTQTFYETVCHPAYRNKACQYVDQRIAFATRCVQVYSYVYAIGRTYGTREQFRIDYIRIPAGCKCQVKKEYLRRRKKSVTQ